MELVCRWSNNYYHMELRQVLIYIYLLKHFVINFLFPQRVAIIDVQDNLEEIVKLRVAYPSQGLILLKMDVSNDKGMDASYDEIMKSFGCIDMVINVAGIFNDLDVQRTLLVNLGGIINSTLKAIKLMSKDKGGNGGIICNMSSVVGLDPMFLVPVYAATKAGIINFTRCLGVSFKLFNFIENKH